MSRFFAYILIIWPLFFTNCVREEKFDTIGMAVSSPSDAAVSDDGAYFFVLNTDFYRKYNRGSLMVLKENGEKVTALELPRLGRSLTVAGNDAVITTDRQDPDSPGGVHLIDVSNPAAPVVKRSYDIDCTPINAALRKNYNYFFVTCDNGELYVGLLAADRTATELKKIRNYGYPRRAMYIDTKRNLLIQFPTRIFPRRASDEIRDDIVSYDENGNVTATPNDIPDNMEDTASARINKTQRQRFEITVLNIANEAAVNFPMRENKDPIADYEFRFLYFSLANFDGTPDPVSAGVDNLNAKYYRTNFWDAQPDPNDQDVFYLSQRGSSDTKEAGTVTANHIVRVRYLGDLFGDGKTKPKTGEVLGFERVYGFKGELHDDGKLAYPSHFEIKDVQGQRLIVVNHMRDLARWPRSQSYFSIAAKILDNNNWVYEKYTQDGDSSYYQFAMNKNGRAVVCGYYGDVVILLDIKPGVDITELQRIQ